MPDESENRNDETNKENSAASEVLPRKHSYNLFGTILLALLFVVVLVWIRFTPGQFEPDEDSPPEQQETQLAETLPAEQKNAEDLRDSQISDALNNFLALNYKDWQPQGKSFDDDASDEDRLQVFDVHLMSGNKNQVIRVSVEKFQKDDNSEYWFAYQPDNRQLLESTVKYAAKKSSDDSPEKSEINGR